MARFRALTPAVSEEQPQEVTAEKRESFTPPRKAITPKKGY